jgi:hypothetical protein
MMTGDFVWYRGWKHVVLDTKGLMVELIRYGDKTRRTFWTVAVLCKPLSKAEIERLLK